MPILKDTEDNESSALPIYRIPPEVTLEIFTRCLPEALFPRLSVRSAPLQLSHVCTTWRNLALRTPRLWCRILLGTRYLEVPEDGSDYMPGAALDAMALKCWVERAGSHLMSADIRYPNYSRLTNPYLEAIHLIPPVFRVIVRNRMRWKGLKISMPGEHLLRACFVTQRNAPYLETLEVDDTFIPTVGPVKSKIRIYLPDYFAETLSTLSVPGGVVYRSFQSTSFPKLRNLFLKHSCIEECLYLLKHCPVLVYPSTSTAWTT
ncbi:hypothetical protein BD410DRAFT_793264 [Rickenella mellea]|uniref:Uncharacterized protein n=1 Tax=Rickenella mellea TaxID=50990 RepID=A0A4Y7PSJ5_9AGAM|nr:hypothetical protein BD410DRAFT_793264 [Rickenella mellea]